MVILSVVLSSVLDFVSFTKERIGVNLTAIRSKAIREAVRMNVDGMDLREMQKTFREKIQTDEFDGRRSIYRFMTLELDCFRFPTTTIQKLGAKRLPTDRDFHHFQERTPFGHGEAL
jgi:hypothetical protein